MMGNVLLSFVLFTIPPKASIACCVSKPSPISIFLINSLIAGLPILINVRATISLANG
jgi:hypothetical protein